MTDILLLGALAIAAVAAYAGWGYADSLRSKLGAELKAHDATTKRLGEEQIARGSAEADKAIVQQNLDEASTQYVELMLEKQNLAAENTELQERIATLSLPVIVPPKEPLTEEQRKTLLAAKCMHCGGAHNIACPRVKRMRFRADGSTPLEVEFFPDGEWPKDRIIWLEDLYEPDAPTASVPASTPAA